MREISLTSSWLFGILLIAAGVATADEPNPPAHDLRAAKSPSEEQIKQWVRQLGDDKVAVRDAATEALISAGIPAVLPVRHAKYNAGLSVRNRATDILRKIDEQAAEACSPFCTNMGSEAGHVRGVFINKVEGLRFIPAFSELEGVGIGECDVRNGALSPLQQVPWLKVLGFHHVKITDDDLVYLETASGLRKLRFQSCSLDGAALRHIASLDSLEQVEFFDTPISGNALKHLSKLLKVRRLYLQRTCVNDAGLSHLKHLSSLTLLDLIGTDVTDAGLRHVVEMESLETVWLMRTKVTSKGVMQLKDLPRLKAIGVSDGFSNAEYEELRQAFGSKLHVEVVESREWSAKPRPPAPRQRRSRES